MFLNCLKVVNLLPVYKFGEKSELCNYRLKSVLSSISKVLEKLIHERSSTFFNKYSIFLSTPYGVRENHSTMQAVLDVVTSS